MKRTDAFVTLLYYYDLVLTSRIATQKKPFFNSKEKFRPSQRVKIFKFVNTRVTIVQYSPQNARFGERTCVDREPDHLII